MVDQIIQSIDAEIAVLQPELERLKAARLALTVAPASAPAAEAPARVDQRKRRRLKPNLTLEAALPGIRDAIADGPKTITAIIKALGYGPNNSTRNIARQALEQLGAEAVGGGGIAKAGSSRTPMRPRRRRLRSPRTVTPERPSRPRPRRRSSSSPISSVRCCASSRVRTNR